MKDRKFIYLFIIGFLILIMTSVGHLYWIVPDYLGGIFFDVGMGFIVMAFLLWNRRVQYDK